MKDRDSLGDRMKKNYEDRSRHYLLRRTPVVVRVYAYKPVSFYGLRSFGRLKLKQKKMDARSDEIADSSYISCVIIS